MTNSTKDLDERVGVVIPVYNRRTTLLGTLPYVLAQTHAPTRLVIVDDGSTDGSADAAEDWLARRNPSCAWRVVRAPHVGAASARQIGLELVADLPFVTFLDSDDHWPADFLQRGLATLLVDEHAVAVSIDCLQHFADGSAPCHIKSQQLADDPLRWFFECGDGVTSCVMLRTQAVLDVGGWDPTCTRGEDTLLFCRVATRGGWRHAPGEPVAYDVGSAQARGEQPNLSLSYTDGSYQLAELYEQLFDELIAGRPAREQQPFLDALAVRWKQAGKQMWSLGRLKEAEACFARAVDRRPMQIKSWCRLASAKIGRRLTA